MTQTTQQTKTSKLDSAINRVNELIEQDEATLWNVALQVYELPQSDRNKFYNRFDIDKRWQTNIEKLAGARQ